MVPLQQSTSGCRLVICFLKILVLMWEQWRGWMAGYSGPVIFIVCHSCEMLWNPACVFASRLTKGLQTRFSSYVCHVTLSSHPDAPDTKSDVMQRHTRDQDPPPHCGHDRETTCFVNSHHYWARKVRLTHNSKDADRCMICSLSSNIIHF